MDKTTSDPQLHYVSGSRMNDPIARLVALVIAFILACTNPSSAGALFECKTKEALEWGEAKFTPLDRQFDAFWHVSESIFYVDTDAKKLRFPDSISFDFEMSQDGGGGNDWVVVGRPYSNSRDLYLRIRPYQPGKGGSYPPQIPFGGEMPFLLIHPFHIVPVTGTCKGLAGPN